MCIRDSCENVLPVVQKALDDAQVTLADLDGIAVTYAPGLIGALLVGVNFAKGLALATGKPLVPVHHLAGHIAANYIAHPELKPPYLCLVASGGHSHIVEVLSYTEFRIVGRTRDDAAGECFDKTARAMAVSPSVLLMDEPASALDPISTAKVEELIHELKKDYTIVIVTHNMQQAARISDKTAFFLLGEVVEYGETEQIFSMPKDKRTEDYITGRFG